MLRVAAASSYTLGWESPVAISTVGDSIVSTDGTLLEAKNTGEAVDKTVNGITFTGVATRDELNSAYFDAGNFQDGVVGAAFEGMLDSFAYDGADTTANLTLTGLTYGVTYLLQVFVSDDRGGTVTQTMTVGAYSSTATLQSASFSAICQFVASGTTQVVGFSVDTGNPILNGFQVRALP